MKTIDSFNLSGKIAIVTGGAGLLGNQFVKTLSEAKAKVVLVDLDFSFVDKELKENNSILFSKTDITVPKQVENMIENSLLKFGKIDILINSAAIDPKFDKEKIGGNNSSFEKYSFSEWQKALNVNLTGSFLCCQKVGKIMVKQKFGNIINIASTYGIVGPNQTIYKLKNEESQKSFKPVSYSVTKGGLVQLTRYLAAYWGNKNIRVNTLSPGGVKNSQSEEFIKNYSSKTPIGRMANLDELNGALLFLASDASSYMTGANLVVDGGWTAW